MKFTTTNILFLAGIVGAAPSLDTRGASKSAAALIEQIAPETASCSASLTECRTATQIAPYLIKAFKKYDIQCETEIAACISLMAFESNNFQYKHNISPGRPGQGTANMQMITYNEKYAASIPALQDKVSALGTISSDAQKNQLLALVTPDQYNFGSGPWFLKTQCPDLQTPSGTTGADAFWTAYMGCVGVSPTDEGRLAYWNRAKTAFALS